MLKRIMTAVVGIPIVALTIIKGGAIFALLVAALSLGAWWEFRNMVALKNIRLPFMFVVGHILCLLATWYQGFVGLYSVSVLVFAGMFLYALSRAGDDGWMLDIGMGFWGYFYTAVLFAHFILLRKFAPLQTYDTVFGSMSFGQAIFWTVVLGTWASDTFAYFFGIALGKHKACPTISPKKSWEGYIAGFILSIVTVLYAGNYLFGVEYFILLFVAVITAVFAPLGDLLESLFKRCVGIKDSGSFFPGHGGVLDRLDSLVIVIPILYHICLWTLG